MPALLIGPAATPGLFLKKFQVDNPLTAALDRRSITAA
jgi:hypothetical protein